MMFDLFGNSLGRKLRRLIEQEKTPPLKADRGIVDQIEDKIFYVKSTIKENIENGQVVLFIPVAVIRIDKFNTIPVHVNEASGEVDGGIYAPYFNTLLTWGRKNRLDLRYTFFGGGGNSFGVKITPID